MATIQKPTLKTQKITAAENAAAGEEARLTERGGRLHSAGRHLKLLEVETLQAAVANAVTVTGTGRIMIDDGIRFTEGGGRLHSAGRHKKLHSAGRRNVRSGIAAAAVAAAMSLGLGAGLAPTAGSNAYGPVSIGQSSVASIGGHAVSDVADTATGIAITRTHAGRQAGDSGFGFVVRIMNRFNHAANAATVTASAQGTAKGSAHAVAPHLAVAAAAPAAAAVSHRTGSADTRVAVVSDTAATAAAPEAVSHVHVAVAAQKAVLHKAGAVNPEVIKAPHHANAKPATAQHAAKDATGKAHLSITISPEAKLFVQRELWEARTDFNSQFNLSQADPAVRVMYGTRAVKHALEARTEAAKVGDGSAVRDANALLARILYDIRFNDRLVREGKTYGEYVSVSTTGWRRLVDSYSSTEAVNYVNMLIVRATTLGNEAGNLAYSGERYTKNAWQLELDDTRGADVYAKEALKYAAGHENLVGAEERRKALMAAERAYANRKFLMKEIRMDEAEAAAKAAAASTAPVATTTASTTATVPAVTPAQ